MSCFVCVQLWWKDEVGISYVGFITVGPVPVEAVAYLFGALVVLSEISLGPGPVFILQGCYVAGF